MAPFFANERMNLLIPMQIFILSSKYLLTLTPFCIVVSFTDLFDIGLAFTFVKGWFPLRESIHNTWYKIPLNIVPYHRNGNFGNLNSSCELIEQKFGDRVIPSVSATELRP